MGAWTNFYKKGLTAPYGTPLAYGIMACKAELIYNGYSKNVNSTLNVFGDAASKRTKEFQKDNGLEADGVIGPITSKALFKKRILEVEQQFNIPDNLICKQIALESGFDPAATGTVDPRDRGFAQINSHWHPDVEDSEAFDPAFSIVWTSQFLADNLSYLKDVDAAIAAHNVGRFYAKKWLEAGKPATGLLTLNNKDYAEICTRYVGLIKSKTC
jgi:hypothetical protein